MDPNVKFDLDDDCGEKKLEYITDYQAVVGSLLYAALATRPDISYVVAALSRYNLRPFTSHITAAKRVLQYLKSTADFRLHFTTSAKVQIDYRLRYAHTRSRAPHGKLPVDPCATRNL